MTCSEMEDVRGLRLSPRRRELRACEGEQDAITPSTENFDRILPFKSPSSHAMESASPGDEVKEIQARSSHRSQRAAGRRPILCIKKVTLNEYFKLLPPPPCMPHYLRICCEFMPKCFPSSFLSSHICLFISESHPGLCELRQQEQPALPE